MAKGRPVKGPGLVEGLEGSEEAKRRLEVILETMGGQKSVQEAIEQLGLRKSMFHEIRMESLKGALESLEAKPRGRPRQEVTEDQRENERLRKEIEELKAALQIAHVREEIALVMPHVLKGADAKKKRMEERKKRRRRAKSRRQKARRRGS
jgi:hypothetical protein